ncbi:hypothetical protein DTO013E5_5705 [Penicillium roqueforti]|uniref:Genomic scaffold, ProqFM164S02 n=1 Tax=Penicillium roqueforti (strain FM164) TaxID=1365484 RepID=W6QAP3_PENRF|nr:uncharacterized protein LCP9604111_7953 [Penicillium roqueforti]XP_057046112.1 uncharacterized protein N7518_003735 [Penicillium psychrosexuale]CDM33106.1 unnamed protein product [Penicillium roqueforti FM164]KAF9242770.1 hypothetical protein LCP9604111_7953 [Penicillium roqueforti]KAI1830524.1 hypothetical protein CBS147337_8590 [Penicillium roqueforti]KAI2674392.1 hypothetical protein CBS147355_7006 [Penicillium roqueforti]KAI2683951.1 hypothetical protein LCP963914a_5781 [Penicillium ro
MDDDDHVPRSWFPEGLDPGDEVTLNKPTRSEWVIDRLVNKHSYQCADRSLDSYACVLFECHNAAGGQEAFMRVYAQVPHTCYEDADRATRTREATEFTPPELKAYKFLKDKCSQNTPLLLAYKQGSQDSRSGAVPRGHLTWIVWEKVPGDRLGDFKSAFVYWDMDREERKRVREAFLRELPKAQHMGYFPEGARPRNLVWNSDTGALYFVGFRDAEGFKAKGTFGIEWLPRFDLARPPRSYLWNKSFNGDISDWKV